MLTISLPWPDKGLNPNGRIHPISLHRKRKAAGRVAWALTREAMGRDVLPGSFGGRVAVSITFHPETAHRRDVDNLIASMKGQLDGIAAALGIDDSAFDLSGAMGEKRFPACVVVTLTPALILVENRGVIR